MLKSLVNKKAPIKIGAFYFKPLNLMVMKRSVV